MKNKKLYKSSENRMVSGVCGGVAEYFGIDVTIVRLIYVIASLFTAFSGIILYVIAAIIIPYEGNVYPNSKRDDIVDPK